MYRPRIGKAAGAQTSPLLLWRPTSKWVKMPKREIQIAQVALVNHPRISAEGKRTASASRDNSLLNPDPD
jgi:hypothetical protein